MTNDVILVIPLGAHDTPIAHGAVDYQPSAYRQDINDPNSKWLVPVPPQAAQHFCHNAGFYPMTQESEPTFTGEARLYAPHGCSWNGVDYHPDADDIVVVPAAAVADLLAFPPICPETLRPGQERIESDRAELSRRLAATQSALDTATTLVTKREHEIAVLEGRLRAASQPLVVDSVPMSLTDPAAKPGKSGKT